MTELCAGSIPWGVLNVYLVCQRCSETLLVYSLLHSSLTDT